MIAGATHVKWHPPATAVADGGPMGSGIQPERIRYKGKEWVVAWSHRLTTLWVLADSDAQVKDVDNAVALCEIAKAYRTNAVHKTMWLERLGDADTSIEAVSARGRKIAGTDAKSVALRGVTHAVTVALGAGATLKDVRLAVYSAMGLDDDAAA